MTVMKLSSLVSPGRAIDVDPYSPTALEDEYKSVNETTYSIILKQNGPAPKMFDGGTSELPSVTSSGISPELLLKLPYRVRHAAAADPSLASVRQIFEEYSDFPEAILECPGLRAAVQRVQTWIRTIPKATPAEDPDALYAEIFGNPADKA